MKEKVYLFGAYFGTNTNGRNYLANYLLAFPSIPSLDDIKNELKKGDVELCVSTILNMQFLTKEQYYALKGEKPDEQQSKLLDKKIDECDLSIRVKNICKQNGLNTVRDVCRLHKVDWFKFRNSGKKSLSEVDNFMKYYGLDWGMNV